MSRNVFLMSTFCFILATFLAVAHGQFSPEPFPNVTTLAPNVTTLAPNVTTLAPTTVAPPKEGIWKVKNGNVTCIMAKLCIHIIVPEISNKTHTYNYEVPYNASANTSYCKNDTQLLELSWNVTGNITVKNTLSFNFTKKTEKRYVLSEIGFITYTEVPGKNASSRMFHHNKTEYDIPLNKSYRCAAVKEIKLKQDGNATAYAFLQISDIQIEAFHQDKSDTNFSAAEDCASSPDIVPIAVGCALVGLVATVLIAYLVGRRRSHARGYLSM